MPLQLHSKNKKNSTTKLEKLQFWPILRPFWPRNSKKNVFFFFKKFSCHFLSKIAPWFHAKSHKLSTSSPREKLWTRGYFTGSPLRWCSNESVWRIYSKLTLEYLMVTKRSHILKPTCRFQLQFCLTMCDSLVATRD